MVDFRSRQAVIDVATALRAERIPSIAPPRGEVRTTEPTRL
jgi:hypothetical protein